jgi:tetratricopeptide (TPR) repeat protein
MPRSRSTLFPVLIVLALAVPMDADAQRARISEEIRTLDTYPFSEPNPIPMLARDPRLYPYHSFEGYSTTSEPREWKVVHLENDLIEVFVLPEVGGKVWGAIVKRTGHEFIYRNEVMKFRNIALRGPWTSGGIEFNFGVIGHTPATATPVDYTLRENDDGSVSCFVGSMDLPSRTHWRVEIRLPADRAYFETRVLWYNPTPLQQPYYNWMTAAAFARDDLEMSIPGNGYLQHSGNLKSWPVDDEGRYLPLYRNNTFAGHKSYHVVGELNDFFGGYYHDDDYGFGHWARYEEMPGQKLWLWALSREGGVWEDLLTDTDGQYVEFQAGRLFVQYSPGADANPITQAAFDPLSASRWTETWFPLEGIGGLTDASREGAMHVQLTGDRLEVAVHAFGDIVDTLEIWSAGQSIERRPIQFSALDPVRTTARVAPGQPYRVRLAALDLDYRSDPSTRELSRPFATPASAMPAILEADRLVFEANELRKARRYEPARALYERALEVEPWNQDARIGMADLDYRSGRFDLALEHVTPALQLDAYDPEANFLAGIIYQALGRTADAHDSFGFAARSTAYRSAAYVQLAKLAIASEEYGEAMRYARLAIDYDRYGIPGWRALAIAGRRSRDAAVTAEALAELEAIDPLHHFVEAERYLATPGPEPETAQRLADRYGGEFPGQTQLELAIRYANLGLGDDALVLLGPDFAPLEPISAVWRAYLHRDPALLPAEPDVAFQFPFRTETLAVLEWADEQSGHWAWTYLRGLNLWGLGRVGEAVPLLQSLQDRPDEAVAYAARGLLLASRQAADPIPDLARAVELDPATRAYPVLLIQQLQMRGDFEPSLNVSRAARNRFPDDFNLKLLEVRALLHANEPAGALELLEGIQVLPSENASESHRLYEQAHTLVALDRLEAGRAADAREHLRAALEWPESLGQGRPYAPEERLVRFLLGRAEGRLGNEEAARLAYRAVLDGTPGSGPRSRLDLLAIAALHALGRGSEVAPQVASDNWPNVEAGQFAARWAEAIAGGKSVGAAFASLADEAPGLFEDLDGRLLRRVLMLEG